MKTLNYVKILLLCMLTFSFASCGDEYYTDDYLRNSDDKLCGKTWVDEYTTEENELCKHQLKFAKDYSGREVFQFYRNGENRPYKENSYTFDWKWTDSAMENLEINYGAGDIVYFDNVWVREHNLQGKLNGAIVMFVDANL
ncbi:hypothetical protein [Bacteroides fluxus]|jgi:hypothetical protein|uniref:Lipoprotein n=1 Tax=Bacteroides fluxus YIT 12057 TaxID=763034 RepID=F3PXE2_9BACE|nr:hypothetical protein [Bacteroides fluxus]EGF51714.1 hypothetical protein HMPREF9446_03434 [Bacteroides fluxus YIT 12057]MDY3790431.1 hypothetical protein [Bacteroides fluxus]